MINYSKKYNKYKLKYLRLKNKIDNQIGGVKIEKKYWICQKNKIKDQGGEK